jgi:hypothetical protein
MAAPHAGIFESSKPRDARVLVALHQSATSGYSLADFGGYLLPLGLVSQSRPCSIVDWFLCDYDSSICISDISGIAWSLFQFSFSSCWFTGQVTMDMPPNQSPEPTAVTAAVAVHAASRRWLSFFR